MSFNPSIGLALNRMMRPRRVGRYPMDEEPMTQLSRPPIDLASISRMTGPAEMGEMGAPPVLPSRGARMMGIPYAPDMPSAAPIEAEAAPAALPITRPGPYPETVQGMYESGDPVQRRVALRERGVSYADQDALNPTPGERQYMDLAAKGPSEHRGFWGRLKDAAIGGLIGGPIGFGVGLAAPNVIHKVRHNIDLGQAEHRAGVERGITDNQMQSRMRLAGLSGIDPATGDLTQEAEGLNLSRMRLEQQAREAQSQAGYRGLGATDRLVDTYGQFGIPVPEGAVAGTPYEGVSGRIRPQRESQVPHTIQTDQGILQWNPESKTWTQAAGPENQPLFPYQKPAGLTPYQERQLSRQEQADLNTQRKDAEKIRGEFEKQKAMVTKAAAELTAMWEAAKMKKPNEAGVEMFYYRGKYHTVEELNTMRAQYEAAQAQFQAAQQAARTHPMIRMSPDGTAIEVERQGGQARQQQAPTGRPKVFPAGMISGFAQEKGMTEQQARQYIESRGYTIQ